MIIIGDPKVQQKGRRWYDFMERLSTLRVMTGERFVLSSERPPFLGEDENNGIVSVEVMISQTVNALSINLLSF